MSQTVSLPSPAYAKSLLAAASPHQDPPQVTSTIASTSLQPHPEGGFFVETDRDPRLVPNPFLDENTNNTDETKGVDDGDPTTNDQTNSNSSLPPEELDYLRASKQSTNLTRHASTTIHYFLSPSSPLGRFHRNKARTVHTLHWGRGVYVVLHPPEHEKETYQDVEEKAKSGESKVAKSSSRDWRVETFIVGKDVARGEKVQWIVEGGKYKASYLLPDSGSVEELWDSERGSKNGLLISETVVPGFEFSDHDFLTAKRFVEVVGKERVAEMGWLLGKEEGGKLEATVAL